MADAAASIRQTNPGTAIDCDVIDGDPTYIATLPAGKVLRQRVAVPGVVSVSGPLTDTQLRATPAPVRDDYIGGETLAQQSGAGAVLTFTFASPVHLAVVESSGASLVSRADPFGGTPAATTGVPCRDEVPTYLPVTTTIVRVFAPAGTIVNVWGFRR